MKNQNLISVLKKTLKDNGSGLSLKKMHLNGSVVKSTAVSINGGRTHEIIINWFMANGAKHISGCGGSLNKYSMTDDTHYFSYELFPIKGNYYFIMGELI